jgi:hypothetical protein
VNVCVKDAVFVPRYVFGKVCHNVRVGCMRHV